MTEEVVVTLVHGTWARGVVFPSGAASWTTERSPLCQALRARFGPGLTIRRFSCGIFGVLAWRSSDLRVAARMMLVLWLLPVGGGAVVLIGTAVFLVLGLSLAFIVVPIAGLLGVPALAFGWSAVMVSVFADIKAKNRTDPSWAVHQLRGGGTGMKHKSHSDARVICSVVDWMTERAQDDVGQRGGACI